MWSLSVLPLFSTPSHSTSLTFNFILNSRSGLSHTKAPPSQSSTLPRLQRFATGHSQNALFDTGNSGSEGVVVVDWTYGGINDPSVQSKVGAESDSGPEPSVK
ncbi:hypothetical protein BU17DRAFT_79048 [Hysterangium stoloniferum]|nr:hypothetical protein BU17DRAFT_79048 [Hysterangium stoloniferum]